MLQSIKHQYLQFISVNKNKQLCYNYRRNAEKIFAYMWPLIVDLDNGRSTSQKGLKEQL